nr:Chain A, Anti-sigma-I factor RsgI2 [Acetivibrio thermocellus DSM 1313]
MYAYIDVDIN